MNKLKHSLEQRIFILFLIITFLMILALIFIEWQLAKFGIRQYETKNINQVLTNYKFSKSQKNSNSITLLKDIALTSGLSDVIKRSKPTEVNDFINTEIDQTLTSFLAIYNEDLELIYGNSWEMVESYLEKISKTADIIENDVFYSNFGKKLYRLSYHIIKNQTTGELVGYLINVENHNSITPSNEFIGLTYLLPYPLSLTSEYPISLAAKIEKLNQALTETISEQKSTDIYWLSIDQAVGVVLNYDVFHKPVSIFLINYPRDVNRFAQQSVLIFILILLAISIIMITILGTWFKIKILQPVHLVSNTMNQISLDPSSIKPVEMTYEGVLGDLVETFNEMNSSLYKYSSNLKEYKLLTDNMDSGIFWLDEQFRIILFNPGLMRIFGIKQREDLINRNFTDYIKLDQNQIQKALEDSLTLTNLATVIDGSKKFVLLHIRTLRTSGTTKLLGNITDITKEVKDKQAREALELELIKSNRMAEIGKRVEGIVHNLNSPLNSLLGYAQLLKKSNPKNVDIDKIIEAAKNITHLVKGLLSKVKSDSTAMIRPLDINSLIRQEMQLLKHNLFFKHHVKSKIELQDNLPPVRAIYGDISLCLTNILNNALESMQHSEKKELSVKTYDQNKMITIEVTDTGEGIFKQNQEVIFEPYFTTKQSQNGSGFGLGLAISKNIALKYDGHISVTSVRHQGSTFRINLPEYIIDE